MTEKKKRGRPPGSGKKGINEIVANIEPVKSEVNETLANFHPSKFEKMIGVLQDVELAKKSIEKLKKTSSSEPIYPSNWNELGKVAKLQWLTANKK